MVALASVLLITNQFVEAMEKLTAMPVIWVALLVSQVLV
jgi:hypothetical protein